MEQVKLIHDIDLDKKRRKKKRERHEEKLKRTALPAKKSQVPLDTMSGLEKEDIPLEHKEIESEPKQEFEQREREKEHDKLQDIYKQMRQDELARLAAYEKAKQEEV